MIYKLRFGLKNHDFWGPWPEASRGPKMAYFGLFWQGVKNGHFLTFFMIFYVT